MITPLLRDLLAAALLLAGAWVLLSFLVTWGNL